MGRGRPRKPDALKKLEGNPGKGPLNENMPTPAGTPIRPNHVVGYAAEVWDQIINSMPQELYSATDSIALATFCIAADQFRISTEELNRDGLTIEAGDGSIKAHPASVVQSRAINMIAVLGPRLGLDPVSRCSIRMPMKKKEVSKFEGLMNVPMSAITTPPEQPLQATA